MDFFSICRKLNLTPREREEARKHLMNMFPFEEHAQLTQEEIEVEVCAWQNEKKWEKQLEDDAQTEYEFEFSIY